MRRKCHLHNLQQNPSHNVLWDMELPNVQLDMERNKSQQLGHSGLQTDDEGMLQDEAAAKASKMAASLNALSAWTLHQVN